VRYRVSVVHPDQGSPCIDFVRGRAINRYTIDSAATDWSVAEAQLAKGGGAGRTTVVSIKGGVATGQKRKADSVDEKSKKPTRRGKKPKR
jgi:N-acetyltransferase 10